MLRLSTRGIGRPRLPTREKEIKPENSLSGFRGAAAKAAVDVGGTFTDLITFVNGRISLFKVPTTKDAPEKGVLGALSASKNGFDSVIHATTVATNALLTGRYPRVAILTTKGFRDVIEIGRQARPELYNPYFWRPAPLVPRELRLEISERVEADGRVTKPLDPSEVKVKIRTLRGAVKNFAICFVNSYVNPVNEESARNAILEDCPECSVTASYEVNREIKEYERMSTTVVNAVLKPVVSAYIQSLETVVKRLLLMQSNGGFVSARTASRIPVTLIESGPAAGAVGVAYLSRKLGKDMAIGFDMGGTTAKASTVIKGELSVTSEYEVGGRINAGRVIKGSGYPVRSTFIDLAEVSSGGGTVVWRDKGGALRVGPESAESDPGPACYGKGGTRPTITDSHLVLGHVPMRFAGGLVLSPELSLGALRSLGEDPIETALDALELANSQMSKAIRIVTAERGLDPADFTVFAFGGAGPMHVADIMAELGIRRAIVPPAPGLFSAYGLLVSDYKVERSFPYAKDMSEGLFRSLEKSALESLDGDDITGITVERLVDARYRGQLYELTVPYGSQAEEAFHERFKAIYGYSMREREVEFVNLRLRVVATVDKPALTMAGFGQEPALPRERREVVFRQGTFSAPVYDRNSLVAGFAVPGPAIIESFDSTTIVPPSFECVVDGFGNLLVNR